MKADDKKTIERVRKMIFAKVYPFYIAKAEKKGRTKAEVDQIIHWLTGYTAKGLESQLKKETNFGEFFKNAPKMNARRKKITGVVCGVRVEEIKDSFMREVRYLDKLIDELAKGKAMEKVLREESQTSEFPKTMGKVAPRELAVNGINTLKQASKYTEKELLAIHGVGPKAVRIIKEELAKQKLRLKNKS